MVVKHSAWLFAAIMAALLLAGCNTVRGVGEDIEKGGEWIQRSTR